MDDFKENVIEFVQNSKVATVTFCQGRYITKIKKLSEKYPEEVKITHTNEDGSIVAHIPTRWIRINPSKKMSEEQKENLAEMGRRALNSMRAEETEYRDYVF